MKNSESPIHPCIMQQVGKESFRLSRQGDDPIYNWPMQGLTKREYFAAMAMQGLFKQLSVYVASDANIASEMLCKDAVAFADQLLTELEK